MKDILLPILILTSLVFLTLLPEIFNLGIAKDISWMNL